MNQLKNIGIYVFLVAIVPALLALNAHNSGQFFKEPVTRIVTGSLERTETPYTPALILERGYLTLSKALGDSPEQAEDARYFAQKALLARRGEGPRPEPPMFWHIPEAAKDALKGAHDRITRLKGLLSTGDRKLATHLAKVQVIYDCAVLEAEYGSTLRLTDLVEEGSCRAHLTYLLSRLELEVATRGQKSVFL